MKDQVTSPEQSKRLIELRAPAEKSSMVWEMDEDCARLKIWNTDEETKYILHNRYPYYFIPAFTVADLLGILPEKISCKDPFDGHLRMRRFTGENGSQWIIDYDDFAAERKNIIDALAETVEWLLSNGYKLNV